MEQSQTEAPEQVVTASAGQNDPPATVAPFVQHVAPDTFPSSLLHLWRFARRQRRHGEFAFLCLRHRPH